MFRSLDRWYSGPKRAGGGAPEKGVMALPACPICIGASTGSICHSDMFFIQHRVRFKDGTVVCFAGFFGEMVKKVPFKTKMKNSSGPTRT